MQLSRMMENAVNARQEEKQIKSEENSQHRRGMRCSLATLRDLFSKWRV
jgi:hypothetical protein